MKSPLIIYPAMLALLFTACDERKVNATDESIEAQNEMSGPLHEQDTDMVKQDGTLLPGAIEQFDSIPLPATVTSKINEDVNLSKDSISGTKKFTEDGVTYYEVKFRTKAGETKTVVFDEKGKLKSSK